MCGVFAGAFQGIVGVAEASTGSCAWQRSTVGAGLLAKASCQSTSALTDTPPSRASPLPQLDLCFSSAKGWQPGEHARRL
ncbi:hypothetical protein DJ564_22690 [Pseudomonas sp. 31-12]|nr:hypothetical protein DJ564_22690 [Pseudomonas sp. 31-12]